jgi:hypothetical protein
MAADSASSFASGMVYRHADKIVNLRQGLPIGVMVTGAGGHGATLLRRQSVDLALDCEDRVDPAHCRDGEWRPLFLARTRPSDNTKTTISDAPLFSGRAAARADRSDRDGPEVVLILRRRAWRSAVSASRRIPPAGG